MINHVRTMTRGETKRFSIRMSRRGAGTFHLYVDGVVIPLDSQNAFTCCEADDDALRELLDWLEPYAPDARRHVGSRALVDARQRVVDLTAQLAAAKATVKRLESPAAIYAFDDLAIGYALEIRYQFAAIVSEAQGFEPMGRADWFRKAA